MPIVLLPKFNKIILFGMLYQKNQICLKKRIKE